MLVVKKLAKAGQSFENIVFLFLLPGLPCQGTFVGTGSFVGVSAFLTKDTHRGTPGAAAAFQLLQPGEKNQESQTRDLLEP